MKKERVRKEYPLNAKTIFGLSTMRWTITAASSLMTSAFLLYLTDYSGMGSAAATIGTILLLAGRLFDAFDDPLQGWIMDRSKRTRIGKFKPFMLGGIITCSAALLMLFNIPAFPSMTARIVWLSVAYLMYEIGYSFQPHQPIIYSLTGNPTIRQKLLVTPRIIEQVIVIPFSFFLSLVVVLGNSLGDMKKAVGLLAAIFVLPMGIMALIGTICVKEGHVVEASEKVGFRQIIAMFKTNRPLWISFLSGIFGGSVFTFIMASAAYYIKWAFGKDNFGTNAAIWGAIILIGIIIGTLIAPRLLKGLDPVKGTIVCSVSSAIILAVNFVLAVLGLRSAVVFFGLMFVYMIVAGMSYIPATLIGMETMDYSLYKIGHGMEALNQAARNFLEKAQSAIASSATGAVLIAVGYVVDKSDNYIGTAPVESLLSGLILVSCLIPAALSLIAAIIMILFYPIKGKVRQEMYAELDRRKAINP